MSASEPLPDPLRQGAPRLAAIVWLLLGALAAMTFFWGFLRAESLAARADNPRLQAADRRMRRGRILDRAGRELAASQADDDGLVRRRYPWPSAAPVVGFQTWRYGAGARAGASYGAGGAEAAYDAALRGDLGLSLPQLLATRVLQRPQRGHDVVLTLDARLQAEAFDALGGREGAVVVLDVASGAVRALVSVPTFDPATLDRDMDVGSEQRLLNRATQGLYPPGSTWKVVTLGAALAEDRVRLEDRVADGGRAERFGGFRVACDNNPPTVTEFDIGHALAYSCNLTFARLGVQLGAAGYREAAERFGVGERPPFRLPTVASQLDADGQMDLAELASAAFGQGEVLVTPLHMAMIAAASAGDGRLRKPYLLADVPEVRWRSLADETGTWRRALPGGAARQLRQAMILSAEEGWAGAAKVGRGPGFTLGAKTGTAELDVGRPHAWTIGFAPAERPRVATAVLLVHGGEGSAIAAPIAGRVLERALALEADAVR